MSNITSLRKAGNLTAAYKLAKQKLDENSTDIWAKRDMSWVLYDFAKQNATVKTKEQFLKCLDQLIALDMPETEDVLYQSITFLIRGMASTMIRAAQFDNQYFNKIFEYLKQLKVKKQTPAYSSILNVMLRAKTWWTKFKEFYQWWGFDSFLDNDFKSEDSGNKAENSGNKTENSSKKMMPLAEKAVMAYCKCLLDCGLTVEIDQFLPWLDSFAQQHKNYIYLPFYHAKLLWKQGRKNEYYDKMKIFAKKKSGEFWVWELLGDYYDNPQMQLKFYAKAMLCRTKPEMSIKLREKTANLLNTLQHNEMALAEYLTIVKIREKHKWHIAPKITLTIEQLKNKDIKPTKNTEEFYTQQINGVEEMIFGKQLKPTSNKKESEPFNGQIEIFSTGFGFVKYNGKKIFVPQNIVTTYKLINKQKIKGLFIQSFDPKKNKDGYKVIKIIEE